MNTSGVLRCTHDLQLTYPGQPTGLHRLYSFTIELDMAIVSSSLAFLLLAILGKYYTPVSPVQSLTPPLNCSSNALRIVLPVRVAAALRSPVSVSCHMKRGSDSSYAISTRRLNFDSLNLNPLNFSL